MGDFGISNYSAAIRHRISDVVNPGPANQFAFLDENPNTIGWPAFSVAPWLSHFYQLPGSYHSGSSVLSFVDGHVESHRWLDPRTRLGVKPDWWISPDYAGPGLSEGAWVYEPGGPDPFWLHAKSAPPVGGWLWQ